MARLRQSRRVPGARYVRSFSDESGFTIIEVLVSAVLLTIAAIGLFTMFDTATRASDRNRARTAASQLAQSDQERLRSLTATQLTAVNSAAPDPTVVDGRTYTTTSRADWTTDPNSTTSCAGLGKEPGYMKITSTVTWRGALAPVKADSLKSVPTGGYSDTRGSLAVKLLKRDGTTGASGITVSISGASSASAITNASGCALFPFVPVGAYTVSVNQGGYVVPAQPNGQLVNKGTTVAGEQTASVSFIYDQAASLGVRFFTRNPSSGSDIATAGDSFTLANSDLGTPAIESFGPLATPKVTAATGAANTAVAVASAKKVLFPFTDGYKVWAGKCQANDPTASFAPATVAVAPASAATATGPIVFEPMLKLTVKKYTNSAQTTSAVLTAAAKVLITPVAAGCASNFTVNTATAGTIPDASQPTLPYGSYNVCVQDKTSGPTKRVSTTINNTVRNGQAVTLYLPFATTNPAAC